MNTNWQRQDVDPDDIVVDPRFQSRVQLDEATVEEYAQAMRDGTDFPPIHVARIDGKIYLLDGFHRFEAAKRANGLIPFDSIFVNAYVVDCTEDGALEISLTFNTSHGLRRSNDDKRKAVRIAL
jgi:ParB-like chromosome segregation protein Spo0J